MAARREKIKFSILLNVLNIGLMILFAIAIIYFLVQLHSLNAIIGQGHWTQGCLSGTTENGKIKIWGDIVLDVNQCPADSKTVEIFVKKESQKPVQVLRPTPIVSPIIAAPSPLYSVKILQPANYDYHMQPASPILISFSVSLTNISVKPFITNLGFYECSYLDKSENIHNDLTLFETKTNLSKAVLPGETVTANLSGSLEHKSKICQYDSSGNQICNTWEFSKITSCKAYVVTDNSQVSNGWGKYPLNVSFP